MKVVIQLFSSQKLPFRFGDTTAYGIYNGLDEEDVKNILKEAVKQTTDDPIVQERALAQVLFDIFSIRNKLNEDPDIVREAEATYQPPTKELPKGIFVPEYEKWWREQVMTGKYRYGDGYVQADTVLRKVMPMIREVVAKITREEEERARRKAVFEIVEVHELVQPKGGEDGIDGYADITLKHRDSGVLVRMIARNMFDVGWWAFPKRVEGTESSIGDGRDWSEVERAAVDWMREFGPLKTCLRM